MKQFSQATACSRTHTPCGISIEGVAPHSKLLRKYLHLAAGLLINPWSCVHEGPHTKCCAVALVLLQRHYMDDQGWPAQAQLLGLFDTGVYVCVKQHGP